MTDRSEITFVFRVLQLDLFFRQPIPIDRANQLLIFLQQPLPEFLRLLVVHFSYPLSIPQNPHGSATGTGSICIAVALSTYSTKCTTTGSTPAPEQALCQTCSDFI